LGGAHLQTGDSWAWPGYRQRIFQQVAVYDAETLIGSANASVKILNDTLARYKERISTKETEGDIKSNVEFSNASDAIDSLKLG